MIRSALTRTLRRAWRWLSRATPDPVFFGRQQLRCAARTKAARQIGIVSVPRKVRRATANDIAKSVLRGRRNG